MQVRGVEMDKQLEDEDFFICILWICENSLIQTEPQQQQQQQQENADVKVVI